MAQLSDDCFAFGGELLTVDAALRAIATIDCVSTTEFVPLDAADSRVLAEDVIAPVDLPPFDNAAVDGYAVRLADVRDAGVLPVEGRVVAGAPVAVPLKPATARRIFTGAALPVGADTIFMQEDVRLDDEGRVHLPSGLKPGANTRPRGEDIVAGARALRKGQILRPQHLALAAALGIAKLAVRTPIRIALFSTGDELVEPGMPAGASQRNDSNRVLLTALARRAGAHVTDLGILSDRRNVIAAALAEAAHGHDLILTSGGVSVGEEDHVRAAVEADGRLTFWRLAIKPGRPVAMGTVAGTPFVGLPGNPVAAFITFVHVARPLIGALAGASVEPPARFAVCAAFSYRKKAGRREYVRVQIERGADGLLVAHKHPVEGAGILTSLTETAGLVELPETVTRVTPGDTVLYLPYELLV
ncbi:MAG TPA: gephyrin-like molybdotransferase Glp [Acetobacteraceae bacterium]|nr:gephyrin-like molybdotransferase Glp [Acetobacteraceae bacterium]